MLLIKLSPLWAIVKYFLETESPVEIETETDATRLVH
jgi:hypothetical protein